MLSQKLTSEVLCDAVRRKLLESTPSFAKLMQAIDEDRDGIISPANLLSFIARYSFPSELFTDKIITEWFSSYTATPDMGLTLQQFSDFVRQEPVLHSTPYTEPAHPTEASIRAAILQLISSLGYTYEKFFAFCTGGKAFLYDHNLREVLETRAGVKCMDKDWDVFCMSLKTDHTIDHISLQEFVQFLKSERPPVNKCAPDSVCQYHDTDNEVTVIARSRASSARSLSHYQTVSKNPRPMAYLFSERLRHLGTARQIFSKLDRQRFNILTYDDIAAGVKLICDIEVTPDFARSMVDLVRKQEPCADEPEEGPDEGCSSAFSEGGTSSDFVDYSLFLRLYDAQEHILPLRTRRPSSPAAVHGRRLTSVRVVSEPRSAPQAAGQESEADRCLSPPAAHPSRHMNNMLSTSQLDLAVPAMCATRPASQEFLSAADTKTQKEAHEETRHFKSKVRNILKDRGEHLKAVFTGCFSARKRITASELLWFFRTRIGVSVSPAIILRTFGAGPRDVLDSADIILAMAETKK